MRTYILLHRIMGEYTEVARGEALNEREAFKLLAREYFKILYEDYQFTVDYVGDDTYYVETRNRGHMIKRVS